MKILLLCSAGLSTSLLVQRMKEVAEQLQIDATIWNCGSPESETEIPKADVILIGPQMRFLQHKVEKQAQGKPVRVIDMMTYGRMDGEKTMQVALEAWRNRENES